MSFIKDIIECRTYMDVLNGKTATATALILFNLASAALVCKYYNSQRSFSGHAFADFTFPD